VDCLIATVAITADVSLLNAESDFDLIAQRTASGSPIPVRDRVGGAKFEKCLRHPAIRTDPHDQ
jgi:hypothetical protein